MSRILAEYRRRTEKSAALAARARQVFPGGVTHDSRLLDPHPIYVTHAAGSRKWDVDGHEYVDYFGGHGALLLGHNHPQVTAAAREQLERGTHFGACHELEVRWGELVQRLVPSVERIRFTSSGTEATLMAMRLARAATGRPKIIRFQSHFHGWQDHVAFAAAPTPGVLAELAANVLLSPPGDLDAVRRTLAERTDIAAVIVEPTGASWGQVPLSESFLHGLLEATTLHNVVLIFDEVISGFRCSPGGAQAVFGIRPDLTTFAKIIAGGMPGGAVGGKRSILDWLDPAACAAEGHEKIPHQGTFNANPLSASAGIATLEIVAGTDACQRANDFAARLRESLHAVVRDERIPWCVYGTFSGFHIFTNPTREPFSEDDLRAGRLDHRRIKSAAASPLAKKLRLAMLIHGVDLMSWPGGPTSCVHTDDDLDRTTIAFRDAIGMLKADGEV